MNGIRASLICVVLGALTVGAFAQEEAAAESKGQYTLGVVVFPGFELLDVMGPLEMFGNVGPALKIVMVAEAPGEVASAQGIKTVADYSYEDAPHMDILLVPGGVGALRLTMNEAFKDWLRDRAAKADLTTSVCNGSHVLASAGLLDGRRATTNKQLYSRIVATREQVDWIKEARWVDDGDLITSSGVSAGMDMALHIIERLFGTERAEAIALGTEYQWHRDADSDPFAETAR